MPKEEVVELKWELLNAMQDRLSGLIVKNMLVTVRKEVTYIWLTFSPESANLTGTTMASIKKISSIFQDLAQDFWDYDDD